MPLSHMETIGSAIVLIATAIAAIGLTIALVIATSVPIVRAIEGSKRS